MKIIIIGAGAMGCLLHRQLIAHHQISFLPKPGINIDQLPRAYQFTDLNGETIRLTLNYVSAEDLSTADIIICALKAYQVDAAITPLAKHINNDCPVIFQHNGMGVYQQIREKFASKQAMGLLLSTQGAKRNSVFDIQHTGKGRWQLGNYQNINKSNKKINELADSLENCDWHDDIRTIQWTKLAINCAINPLTAIHNVLNGELADKQFSTKIHALIDEVLTQAKLAGIDLCESQILNTVYEVIEQTAVNSSSMREDILAGRPSEIDYINGYVVSNALERQMEAPRNLACVAQIKRLESLGP